MKSAAAAAIAYLMVMAMLSMSAYPATSASFKDNDPSAVKPDMPVAETSFSTPQYDALAPTSVQKSLSSSERGDSSSEFRMFDYPVGDSGYRPSSLPERETTGIRSTRAPGDSYIFYDDFESGTSKWNINSGGGSAYWAATSDRPGYGDNSLYCAGVGAVANQMHTIFYDTAEYPISYLWGTGDFDPEGISAKWARSSNKTYSDNYSYHVAGSNPGIGTNTLFADAMESGIGGWTHGIYSGSADSWALGTPSVGPTPRSGTNCWGTNLNGNYANLEDSFLRLPTLDTRGYSSLSFVYYQYTDFEGATNNWDGGIIENSTGGNWYHVNTPSTNPSPYYDATLSTTYGNPLGGSVAYCYDNLAWRKITANLDSCAGNSDVGVRFALGTDDSTGAPGWYIDDVKVNGTGPQYRHNISSYMIKTLDLTGHTNCVLSFQQWLALEDYYDIAYLKVSTTPPTSVDGPEWTTLATYGNSTSASLRDNGYDPYDYDPNACKWESKSISLSAYDGSEVYLMFLMVTDDTVAREGWYLDEIIVTGYGKSYTNNMNTYAETTVDLTGYDNAYLSFIYWMDAEDFFDIFNVSVKGSADTSWTPILVLNNGTDDWQYDGTDPDLMAREWWNTAHLSLDEFCGDPALILRFWFKSDISVTMEGIYIDEVEIASIFFFDNMESGVGEWVTSSPIQPNWHQVSTDYYSSDTSWWCGYDFNTSYGNSLDEYLIHPFDLRTAETATLRFFLTGHLQPGDYFFIGITMDNGNVWYYYGGLTGDYPGWWQFEIDLSEYLHNECLVAFNLYTNKTQTSIGYWIDDVSVYGTRDRTAPGQVLNLSVASNPGGESLALVWNSSQEIDLSHYRVYRSFTPGGPYMNVANVSANSYFDGELARDTTYYYIVSAVDFAGNEGLASEEASGITTDTIPPAPVQEVTATDLMTGGTVNISWLPNNEKDLAGYRLYYSTVSFTDTSEATYYPLSPVDVAGATYWEIYGLENNMPYHFAVTAIDKSSNENTSIEKTAVATPTDQTPPYISIDNPVDSSTVSGIVDILVSAGDASGITNVTIFIGKGVEATYDHFLRKWVYHWNTATVPDGEVTIVAEVSDIYGNRANDTITVTKESVETAYHIDLSGHANNTWAFVSFPLNISGNIQDILNDTVLGDGQTIWSVAKWFDGQTQSWNTYRKGGTQTFTTITNQMGVWLYLTANGGDMKLTTATGYYPSGVVQINLYTGWNMVGYPSVSDRLASATLPDEADIVSVWKSESPYIEDIWDMSLVTMSMGNAYWVYVAADCVWYIDP